MVEAKVGGSVRGSQRVRYESETEINFSSDHFSRSSYNEPPAGYVLRLY